MLRRLISRLKLEDFFSAEAARGMVSGSMHGNGILSDAMTAHTTFRNTQNRFEKL